MPALPKSMFVGKPYERWGSVEPTGKKTYEQMLVPRDSRPESLEENIGDLRKLYIDFESTKYSGPKYKVFND